jgi:hypothetical protein
MAKGKKSSGKHYTSKGERRNVNKKVTNALRRDYIANQQLARVNNQLDAWIKGKNVVLTVQNPNKNETAKRFIKVRAVDYWGRPGQKMMFKSNEGEAA